MSVLSNQRVSSRKASLGGARAGLVAAFALRCCRAAANYFFLYVSSLSCATAFERLKYPAKLACLSLCGGELPCGGPAQRESRASFSAPTSSSCPSPSRVLLLRRWGRVERRSKLNSMTISCVPNQFFLRLDLR
jgi:hypothetical protein